MIELLKQEIENHGHQARILPVERLYDLQKDIEAFAKNEELNGFQNYIVSKMYKFELPKTNFTVKSVIIIAVPVPAYAKVDFMWKGKSYPLTSLALYDVGGEEISALTQKYLKKALSPHGYHIKLTPTIPLKRLAVSSGLAVYGRNNITYVEGMGSYQILVAYYSDIPCSSDDWTEVHMAEQCSSCSICLNNCPTGAIRADRFLIDNERCLSFFNEFPGEFPDWIPASAHHCVYDCQKCTIVCPMNKEVRNNVIGPIRFSEEETEMIMAGRKFEEFNPPLKKKIKALGMNKWLAAIPRNIKILIDQQEPAK